MLEVKSTIDTNTIMAILTHRAFHLASLRKQCAL